MLLLLLQAQAQGACYADDKEPLSWQAQAMYVSRYHPVLLLLLLSLCHQMLLLLLLLLSFGCAGAHF
jgi:hypothetical protein